MKLQGSKDSSVRADKLLSLNMALLPVQREFGVFSKDLTQFLLLLTFEDEISREDFLFEISDEFFILFSKISSL